MNVVIHSAGRVLALLLTDFAFGAVLYSSFVLLGRLIQLSVAMFKRIDSFEVFVIYLNRIDSVKSLKLVGDVLFCLSAACGLMISAFFHNSGNFRLLSLPTLVFGVTFGRAVTLLLDRLLLRVLFLVKRLADILLSPIRFIVAHVINAISRLIGKTVKRIRRNALKRYTAYCFAKIKDDAKFGLLDDYYKEVSK